ncbi:MAG: nuclear transport factor 2 family protein [Nitriliruptorales bacterium]|nr:nuclear transport factor 2 family protein [Nitriliruptorales bacterium]
MDTLDRWHDLVRTGDLAGLDELLHEDVVFRSPVLFTPVEGKTLTAMYLAGACQVLVSDGSFTYVREVVDPPHAVLEFTSEIDGIEVNGVDMITWDDDGKIIDFKVMVRPKKAFDLVHAKMAALLEQ